MIASGSLEVGDTLFISIQPNYLSFCSNIQEYCWSKEQELCAEMRLLGAHMGLLTSQMTSLLCKVEM